MPREFSIGSYTFTSDALWVAGSFLIIFGIPLALVVHGWRRRKKMEQLARELGCTFIKKQSSPGTIWRRRWRRNIIDGNWRGQKILIYDFYVQEGEDTDGHTMINGKKYEGRLLADYLPVKKIRRVLAGDPTIQPVNNNAKLSVFGWIVGVLYIGGGIVFVVVGIGLLGYYLVKFIISL